LGLAIGAAGLVALPPLGGFWAMLKLIDDLWQDQSGLVIIVIAVNAFLAFGFTRVFCRVFLGQSHVMAERCPEVHWPMALPIGVTIGLMLHLPIVLHNLELLPDWAEIHPEIAIVLIWSTITGISTAAAIYLGNIVAKPVRLPWVGLQNLFAYDFYTKDLYDKTIILAVGSIARLVNWFDQYLVDGLANLFGIVTLLSGQSLKYSTSGQSQFYLLTIVIGMAIIGLWLSLPILSGP
jgi:NAD(P)H-quinone oxidoreductase subunit 5